MTTIVHVRAGLIDAGPNDRGTFDPKALEELCTTEIRHCSGCGSTDDDSLTTGHSYSACCNEPVVSEPCDLSHAR